MQLLKRREFGAGLCEDIPGLAGTFAKEKCHLVINLMGPNFMFSVNRLLHIEYAVNDSLFDIMNFATDSIL